MRNLIYILLLSPLLFLSCRELDSEGVSKITYYPEIALSGEQWNVVMVGEAWTDPGAKATEGGAEIELAIGGDQVDTSTPGVYTITYSATNKDGFSAMERRYVGVITPYAASTDITGSYKRTAGSQGISDVKKIKNGLYTASNVGGTTPDIAVPVTFYHFDGDKLGVPPQVVNNSLFSCDNATVQVGISYKWVVINSGYGTALRTFIKQ